MATSMIQRIEQALDQHFPSGGQKETWNESNPVVKGLVVMIYSNWDELPARLQQKIEDIEINMSRREPFALHVYRVLSEKVPVESSKMA